MFSSLLSSSTFEFEKKKNSILITELKGKDNKELDFVKEIGFLLFFFPSSVPAVLLVRSWILSFDKALLACFFLAFLVLVYLFICIAMSEADQLREKYFYAHSRKYAHKFLILLCFLLFSFSFLLSSQHLH